LFLVEVEEKEVRGLRRRDGHRFCFADSNGISIRDRFAIYFQFTVDDLQPAAPPGGEGVLQVFSWVEPGDIKIGVLVDRNGTITPGLRGDEV